MSMRGRFLINGDLTWLDIESIKRTLSFGADGFPTITEKRLKPSFTNGVSNEIDFDTLLKLIIKSVYRAGIIYGGSRDEEFLGVYSDGQYIYAVGYTNSEGAGYWDALIVKFDKDLNIVARKIYGGSGVDYFGGVCSDGQYIYAVGYTVSEGAGRYDALIVKFDKDLNIVARKTYGGSSDDYFEDVYSDGQYIYAVGATISEGAGGYDALIVKFDKDLNIVAGKVYGGSSDDEFYGVYSDGQYIYAVGYTYSEGAGSADALIVKFDSNLNIVAGKVYGGSSDDEFNGVYSDGQYIYAVGLTYSEGAGGYDALIVKFDSNLNIVAGKVYGGSSDDEFLGVYSDGQYIYAVGDTYSEGAGRYDALIVKFDKDLNIVAGKVYGGSSDDYFEDVYYDGKYIYAVGDTYSEGAGSDDALIVKFPPDLSVESVSPSTLVLQDSNLTLQDSNLTLQDSNLTLQDSHLTLQDSHLTLQDSHLNVVGITFRRG